MFRTITRLLFGGEEKKTPEDVKSGEVVEEGWLVVNHQAENQDAEVPDVPQSNSAINTVTDTTLETDTSVTDPEPTVQTSSAPSNSRAITGLISQPKTLAEVTQLTQKAKSCADRHHTSRNAFQRQNRARQGVQHQSFHLQQPGHRTLSH